MHKTHIIQNSLKRVASVFSGGLPTVMTLTSSRVCGFVGNCEKASSKRASDMGELVGNSHQSLGEN